MALGTLVAAIALIVWFVLAKLLKRYGTEAVVAPSLSMVTEQRPRSAVDVVAVAIDAHQADLPRQPTAATHSRSTSPFTHERLTSWTTSSWTPCSRRRGGVCVLPPRALWSTEVAGASLPGEAPA